MTLLEIDSLVKEFGDLTAVDGVSFDVEEGEFVTIVGPSGCGKTTTLRAIAGLEQPTAGTIRLHGDDITGLAPHERDIGVVFQDYALFPHKTVAENIAFGLKMRGASKDEQQAAVQEMLEIIDLEGYEDVYPHQCSGGEQQRVAVARALAFDPDLVLMDEPLSNLDKKLRQSMRTELKRIQRETGITTVYVTHNQVEALSMGDKLAVMNDGRLEQFDQPKRLYQRPGTSFVADFLGQSTRFDGVLHRNGADPSVTVDGEVELEADDANDLNDGDDVAVFLRNELVDIAPNEPDADNRFSGVVESVDYQGRNVNYYIRVPSLPNPVQVTGRTDRSEDGVLPEGSDVWLSIEPENVIVTQP